MSHNIVSDEPGKDMNAELRDTVLKSGFAGVAATVLVVAMCSPAGFGGLIGTSVASGLGFSAQPGVDENSIRFAPIPAPITVAELLSIHEKLQASDAELDNARAATDAEIDFIRGVAQNDSDTSLASTAAIAPLAMTGPTMRVSSNVSRSLAPAHIDPHLELAELLLPRTSS